MGFYTNRAYGIGSTVGGGFSTVPGGLENVAAGNESFAAGYNAQALHDNSFIWSDREGTPFASTAANQFSVRASGGILFAGDLQLAGGAAAYHNLSLSGGNALGYLYGSFPALADGVHLGYNFYYDANGNGHVFNASGGTSRITAGYEFVGIYIGGVNAAPSTQRLLANSTGVTVNGTFNNSNDRNLKQNFAPVSSAKILEEVTRLPVSEWSYKEDPDTRHVGPVAQDFYSVFHIGTDDKHIAPIDEGGVALAAIQGLNEKVNSGKQQAEMQMEKLEAENAELNKELSEIKQLLNKLSTNKN